MAKNPIFRDIITPNDARIRQELIKKIQPKLGGMRWTPSLGQDRGNIKSGSRYPQGVWC